MANDIVQCTTAELSAAMREAQASAVAGFIRDANLRVRGQTCYYSTVRFQLVASELVPPVPGTLSVTLSTQERQAFAYSLGQSMPMAGFVPPTGVPTSSAVAASLTQTNLSQPKSTRNGERMIITGISCYVAPTSDMELAAWVWSRANVQLVKNDTMRSPLGPLAFFPAISSINGSGTSYNRQPAEDDTLATLELFRMSEGLVRNFDLSAAPVIWMPQGMTDGSLFLAINVDEPLTFTASDRAAAAGVNAWAPRVRQNSAPLGPAVSPAQIATGTYVDIVFRLDGTTESVMSQNQGT